MKNFEYKRLSVLVAALLVLPGCFWNATPETKKESGSAPALYVVNVLSRDLYDDAHIKGSIHADLDQLDDLVAQWDKKTPVVFYCSNYQCTASSHAARQFKNAGFEKVYAYEGGTAQWAQLNKQDPSYILEGPATESYLSTVVPAPEHTDKDIEIITAADLKDKMQQADIFKAA